MYEIFEEMVEFLKSLGDKTRLTILNLVLEEELTAKDIQERLEKSQSTISQHLKILVDAGLLEKCDASDHEVKANVYMIKDQNIKKLIENIKSFIISQKKEELKKLDDINRLDTIF